MIRNILKIVISTELQAIITNKIAVVNDAPMFKTQQDLSVLDL
jgi:hypothetical protein